MSDTKHGWVSPRADGLRARCDGPGICTTCSTEREHEAMRAAVLAAPQIPTTAAHLALVASRTGKNLSLDEVGAVIDAINALGAADDTLARTGNTARDQEMYAAGLRDGEENAKHNAAIRGQAITQAPQLQALADKVVISTATGNESLFLAAVKELLAAVREFRPDAPASPVSTVEQGEAQDEIHALRQCAIKYLTWLGVSDPQAGLERDLRNPEMVSKPITMTHQTARDWKAIDAAVREYLDGYEMEGDGGYYVPNNREKAILEDAIAGLLADDDFLAHMGRPAPAAGDALDEGFPPQPIVVTDKGVIRFKENRIVRQLLEISGAEGYGLNEIARDDFTDDERMQLAQLIGYSVSGYGDLSYVSAASRDRADAIAERIQAAQRQGDA